MDDGFRRVLREAGEDQAAELPAGERALAAIQSAVTELNADRMARWQRNAAARQLAAEAYVRGCEAMGVEPRALDHFPWMAPPPPVRIW